MIAIDAPTTVVELPALQDDRLYLAEEAALYVRISAPNLKRAAAADELQHTYVGRFPRWSAQNIRDIVAGVPHQKRRTRNARARTRTAA